MIIARRIALLATLQLGLTVVNPFQFAHVGVPFDQTLIVTGGTAPYFFERRSALPAGWIFDDSAGRLTCPSPLVSVFSFQVYIRDTGFDNELLITFTITTLFELDYILDESGNVILDEGGDPMVAES